MCSSTVAYLAFANGQEWRVHRPVRLYSFRQKVCVTVLLRKIMSQLVEDLLLLKRTVACADNLPNNVVLDHTVVLKWSVKINL